MEDYLQDGRAAMTSGGMGRRIDLAHSADFVRANTGVHPVPLCPEITLRIADEAFELWFRTEEELAAAGLPPPFWAFAWAGGQALARCVLDRPGWVVGRRVLDLGAGSGLVGIAAMRAGATSVVAADTDPWACVACAINAEENGVRLEVTNEDLLGGPAGGYDTVLVGDLFYDRDAAPRVAAFIRRAASSGADVLIGDPGRSYLPRSGLTRLFEYRVPVTRALEDADIKRTLVWRLDAA
jgi:predicted nicotinamide N-methyase